MSCEHFLEIPPFDDEISRTRITMNLDISINGNEKRSTAIGVSDQSRRIAIKPSIRLSTECLGMQSEIKGIEAAEQEALLHRRKQNLMDIAPLR